MGAVIASWAGLGSLGAHSSVGYRIQGHRTSGRTTYMNRKDHILEGRIGLAKGWHRAKTRDEMRSGYRRLAKLIGMRSRERVAEMEREIFGGDL